MIGLNAQIGEPLFKDFLPLLEEVYRLDIGDARLEINTQLIWFRARTCDPAMTVVVWHNA